MWKLDIKYCAFVFLLMLVGCQEEMGSAKDEVDLLSTFDFENGTQEWEGGLSDFPVGFDFSSDLTIGNSLAPNSLISEGKGLELVADNPHGALFYFFQRKVEGLNPNKTYKLDFEFLMYTRLVSESNVLSSKEIYLKLGAVNFEPKLEKVVNFNSLEYLVLNVDKGKSNSDSGADLINIGSLTEFTEDPPKIISGNTFDKDIFVKADSNGTIWVLVGVDSGMKGRLTFGMDAITVFYTEID